MKKRWKTGWLLPLALLLTSSLSAQATTNVHVDGDFTVTGDTGLGTTSPDAKLEVVGDILADGYVYSETTDRKVVTLGGAGGWYRIVSSGGYGPTVSLHSGQLRLYGFTENNRPTDILVDITGHRYQAGTGINIIRSSSYNSGEFHNIRVGTLADGTFVVDVYRWINGSAAVTGIIEVQGADTLRVLSNPVINPVAPTLFTLQMGLHVMGMGHLGYPQVFGIGGKNVGIGIEAPTAQLHVDGDAKFEDAVYLLSPQGDISMGSYTNGLP